MNKYLISADIEGITGVIDQTFASQGSRNYELARKYMHNDINAVIQGIIKTDPTAWVLVRDAHGDAINLDLERLHPRANLIQGWGNSLNMLEGLDTTFTGVFLVGYHAGGHDNAAVLGHTLSSQVHSLKVNEHIVNEAGVGAIYAGIHNVPIAFISGDDHAVQETSAYLPAVVTVAVKKSLARNSSMSMSLTQAKELLEKGASIATQDLLDAKITPLKLTAPFKVELKLYNIGYRISVFEKLYATLSFDPVYTFDRQEFIIKYTASAALEMLQRLELILQLVYFSKSMS